MIPQSFVSVDDTTGVTDSTLSHSVLYSQKKSSQDTPTLHVNQVLSRLDHR